MSHLEFTIGGESVLVDDIQNELINMNILLLEELTNNPYIEICLNPGKEFLIDQSPEKSLFIYNLISLYIKTIRNWSAKYYQHRAHPELFDFNIIKCKYQINALINLLFDELK